MLISIATGYYFWIFLVLSILIGFYASVYLSIFLTKNTNEDEVLIAFRAFILCLVIFFMWPFILSGLIIFAPFLISAYIIRKHIK